jgi:hypothetical protein
VSQRVGGEKDQVENGRNKWKESERASKKVAISDQHDNAVVAYSSNIAREIEEVEEEEKWSQIPR